MAPTRRRTTKTTKTKRRTPPPSKYDNLSVYDPTTKRVVGGTPAPLTATPPPLAYLDKLYACETADDATIKHLATWSKTTIWDLEHRRLDFIDRETCPALTVPSDRIRCLRCPHWRLTNETPF